MLQEMLKRCKKSKVVRIEFLGGYKYLSNGFVSACIENSAPKWTVDDCIIAIGVTEEEKEKYLITEEEKDNGKSFDRDALTQIQRMQYSLNVCGTSLQPFILPDDRVMFINMDLLAVFEKECGKQYLCDMKQPEKLYIASNGFVIGIVMPKELNLGSMEIFISELHKGIKTSKFEGYFDSGGQIDIEI
ncbi:MAG: hypothetical protein LIO53_02035 [Oscillospiraceae bacterium]|nr:hypothetical protein [Oscillospiraceae bacterium]